MPGGLGGMLGANGLGLGMGLGLPSGLAGGKPHGLGSHDGGSSENLLSSESGALGPLRPLRCLPAALPAEPACRSAAARAWRPAACPACCKTGR